MKFSTLDTFIKGWFVGNFEPSLYKTNEVEVAYKTYKKGDEEEEHYHKIATEITLITKGAVRMNDTIYIKGEIATIEPNESCKFKALEDSETVVIKIPGINNDKYIKSVLNESSIINKNVVFLHVGLLKYGKEIADEILTQLISSDLYKKIDKIYIGVVGGFYIFNDPKIEYLYQNLPKTLYELKTLEKLREFSIKNADYNILYLHTVAASANSLIIKKCKDAWRTYYLYFTIKQYKKCLEALKIYDVCGTELTSNPVNHFSGNIWWTTSNYVKTLVEIKDTYSPLSERHKGEFWICSNKNAKLHTFFNTGMDSMKKHLYMFDVQMFIKDYENDFRE
jgi:quercetin dioxygenase-like cupin family protein